MTDIKCECGKLLRIPAELAGKAVRCPGCKGVAQAPSPAPPPLPAVAPIAASPIEPLDDSDVPFADDDADRDDDSSEDADLDETRDNPLRIEGGRFGPKDPTFFGSPPKSIGPVIRACTSLSPEIERGLSTATRATIAASLALVIGVAIGALAGFVSKNLFTGFLVGLIAYAVSVGPLLLHFFKKRIWHCGYIGAHGAAYFEAKGDPENVVRKKIFLFEEAKAVTTTIIHHYWRATQNFLAAPTYSGYRYTRFNLCWTDAEGQIVFDVFDHDPKGLKKNPWGKLEFWLAVELAWSAVMFEKLLARVMRGKSYVFYLPNDERVVVYEDQMIYERRGGRVVLDRDDLSRVSIKYRTMTIREVGARDGWFTSSGVHTIHLDRMENVRLFIMTLHSLYNVPVREE